MNERIKQLLGQAYDQAVPKTWTTLSSEQLGRIYEKFAELIIEECADLFEVEWGSSMLQGTTAAHYLKQHFGVEE